MTTQQDNQLRKALEFMVERFDGNAIKFSQRHALAKAREALAANPQDAQQMPELTDAQITAGAAILCDCRKPKPIGRNAAIDVFHSMVDASPQVRAEPAQAQPVDAKLIAREPTQKQIEDPVFDCWKEPMGYDMRRRIFRAWWDAAPQATAPDPRKVAEAMRDAAAQIADDADKSTHPADIADRIHAIHIDSVIQSTKK
jgi:hypothetical protein